jgi:23S rRNA (cytosine1962-C5)-methyltransferase
MFSSGRTFDVVVLDPPKLIRSRAEFEEGARKHFDLNRLAMRLVAPGGIMVSCTCAGLLSHDEFLRMIYASARQAGREISPATEERGARHAVRQVQILAKAGAAADHPVATNCPEGEYLQAVFMRLL